ncbi:putative phage shock protein E [Neisseria animaloris]|uniref:rhodanese-like domain-containing protein n=1 Tax=Neisseria animaloris TaxID=326522 RepID=UPI000A19927B|nr:rhodanese-like domain-containing protein [Neisseria animaloris]OSI07648.1 rhodanese-like domain-containing protein [Neisseria animaloris]VEH88274.1 putative phage shock protein E [Neisseria animaloris]
MSKLFQILFIGTTLISVTPLYAAAAQSAAGQTAQKSQSIWIDVRTLEEFNTGHLKGAVNIPHDQIAEKIRSISTDKTQQVNLYCHSGRRAESALQALKKLGYTNVVNHGSYQDLRKRFLH